MRTWIGGLGLVAVLLAGAPGRAAAGDAPTGKPAGKPAVDPKVMLDRLKLRATEWLNARKNLVVRCWNCEGTGVIRTYVGGQSVATECGGCNGKAKRYSKEQGRKILYELKSPAWRRRNDAQDEAGREFAKWRIEDAGKLAPKSWRWERAELVDATHGVAYAFEGDDSVSRPSRWIFVVEGGRSVGWFLWTAGVDGDWPEPATEAEAEEQQPSAAGEPPTEELPKLQALTLGTLVDKVAAAHRVKTSGRAGRVLTLRLETPDAPVSRTLEATVRADAIAYFRGIFPDMATDWDTIRLQFLGTWQDRFGERKLMPYWSVSLDAATFARIRWENLSPEDAFALFTSKPEGYEGWTLLAR